MLVLTASAVVHLLRLLAAAGRGAGAHNVRARGPCGRSVCCSSAGPEPGTARGAVALLRGTGHRCTAASSPELLLHHSGQGQGAPAVPLAWPCTRQGPVAPAPAAPSSRRWVAGAQAPSPRPRGRAHRTQPSGTRQHPLPQVRAPAEAAAPSPLRQGSQPAQPPRVPRPGSPALSLRGAGAALALPRRWGGFGCPHCPHRSHRSLLCPPPVGRGVGGRAPTVPPRCRGGPKHPGTLIWVTTFFFLIYLNVSIGLYGFI